MATKSVKTASQSRHSSETPPRKWRWQIIIVVLFVVYALLTTAIFVMHNKIARISSNQAKPAPPAKRQPKNSSAKTPAQSIATYRSDEHQLQQAIREKPQDPQLHNQLPQLHYRHGQTAKAIAGERSSAC